MGRKWAENARRLKNRARRLQGALGSPTELRDSQGAQRSPAAFQSPTLKPARDPKDPRGTAETERGLSSAPLSES